MFCPRCSEEQALENLRFCSSCGLPLDLVSEVVEGGVNPERLIESRQNETLFTKRNGFIAGFLWFVLFLVFLMPILLMSDVPEEVIAWIAGMGIVGPVFLLIAPRFLGRSKEKRPGNERIAEVDRQKRGLGVNSAVKSLPLGQSVSAQDYIPPGQANKPYETGEMTPSTSVVEQTTKLLRKEK